MGNSQNFFGMSSQAPSNGSHATPKASPIPMCSTSDSGLVRDDRKGYLKGLVHDNAHARRLSLQNKFVGSTLNSNSPLPVQSLKILRFIRTSVALAGLDILRQW